MNKKILLSSLLAIAFSITTPSLLTANDMRAVNIAADKAKTALIAKAAKEKSEANRRAAQSRALIAKNRRQLEEAVDASKNKKAQLEQEISALDTLQQDLSAEEKELTLTLTQTDQMINELIGVIRINAKDIDILLAENQQTVLMKESPVLAGELADENNFPGMDGISSLTNALFQQIQQTGEVTQEDLPIIDRDGKTVTAKVLLLGPFCAAYRLDEEVGFLRYSATGKHFYALSKLPAKRMRRQLLQYMEGETDSVPMDISRGGALQQLTYSLSLWEQIGEGGPIVWPILAIFVIGLLIVCERIIFLMRKHFNSDRFMQQINETIHHSEWNECNNFCNRYLKKPVARIVAAGLQCREMEREEMENVLQEAILREIPPMERFLSTLGMLAAIAPLLGLLGTVTGMIDTFHIITLHGTGDPRLMSGGISEALVTTMLGLGVAIPLMLAQTMLNRSVEKEIGAMEEKAVALVNIIHKNKLGPCAD